MWIRERYPTGPETLARSVPVLEEQIKVVNHRIADLEHNTNN